MSFSVTFYFDTEDMTVVLSVICLFDTEGVIGLCDFRSRSVHAEI